MNCVRAQSLTIDCDYKIAEEKGVLRGNSSGFRLNTDDFWVEIDLGMALRQRPSVYVSICRTTCDQRYFCPSF